MQIAVFLNHKVKIQAGVIQGWLLYMQVVSQGS